MLARRLDARVPAAVRQGPPGKVVVIGRGRLTQHSLRRALGRGGFDVESATESGAGQELVRRHDPEAVILLDMLAPLDGVSLFEAIRSETGCTVVMLDAHDDFAPSIVGFARAVEERPGRPSALGDVMNYVRQALRPRGPRLVDAAYAFVARR